jgi:hypothetical protein
MPKTLNTKRRKKFRNYRKSTRNQRKTKRRLKGGLGIEDHDFNRMELGEAGFNIPLQDRPIRKPVLPKSNVKFVPGNPLFEKYMRKTAKEKLVDDLHKSLIERDKAYMRSVGSRDKYLKSNQVNVLRDNESGLKPITVTQKPVEIPPDDLGILQGLNRAGIGLNEEKDGPPERTDYGFYTYFTGGKKTRRRKH